VTNSSRSRPNKNMAAMAIAIARTETGGGGGVLPDSCSTKASTMIDDAAPIIGPSSPAIELPDVGSLPNSLAECSRRFLLTCSPICGRCIWAASNVVLKAPHKPSSAVCVVLRTLHAPSAYRQGAVTRTAAYARRGPRPRNPAPTRSPRPCATPSRPTTRRWSRCTPRGRSRTHRLSGRRRRAPPSRGCSRGSRRRLRWCRL
jgi:hypothetical protein